MPGLVQIVCYSSRGEHSADCNGMIEAYEVRGAGSARCIIPSASLCKVRTDASGTVTAGEAARSWCGIVGQFAARIFRIYKGCKIHGSVKVDGRV